MRLDRQKVAEGNNSINPTTPDGRYFVDKGRSWRYPNPALDESVAGRGTEGCEPLWIFPFCFWITKNQRSNPTAYLIKKKTGLYLGPYMNAAPVTSLHFLTISPKPSREKVRDSETCLSIS